MSPAIDVYAAASTVYELIAGVAPYEVAPGTSGTSGSRKKTRDIASPYRLKMDTLPDYPVGAHAPGCDLTQLLRREPMWHLPRPNRLSSWGSIQIPRICAMRWRLSTLSCSMW